MECLSGGNRIFLRKSLKLSIKSVLNVLEKSCFVILNWFFNPFGFGEYVSTTKFLILTSFDFFEIASIIHMQISSIAIFFTKLDTVFLPFYLIALSP